MFYLDCVYRYEPGDQTPCPGAYYGTVPENAAEDAVVFRILSDMICVAFNVMIAWYAWEVIRENYEFPEISPTLGIVKAHVEMIIPCTFLLTSWRIIEIYLRRIKEGTLYSLVKNVGEEDTDGYA